MNQQLICLTRQRLCHYLCMYNTDPFLVVTHELSHLINYTGTPVYSALYLPRISEESKPSILQKYPYFLCNTIYSWVISHLEYLHSPN
jgi:hypothetical protein